MGSTPDIIAVPETRISDNNITRWDVELNGHNFIYDNAPPNKRAGRGVLVYLSKKGLNLVLEMT